MSKEFYKYLVKRTIDFFKSSLIKSGEKYILKLDNEEEVKEYYYAMEEFLNANDDIKGEYVTKNDEEYRTAAFLTGGKTNIFIVPEIEITNAFMTRLRNTVQDGWSMLIVCHGPIDSIDGGTENLQKEGMPFNRTQITADIENQIKKSDLSASTKQILLFDLDNKKDTGYMDSYSLNDYAEIIKVLANGVINECDFRNFLLFSDNDIQTMNEKEAKERINENHKLYKKISDSVRFGDPEHDLSSEFSDSLIKKVKDNSNKKEYWDCDITFSEVEKSKKNRIKGQLPLEIEKITIIADGNILSEYNQYFIRPEAEKGVKFNRKHILIFNQNNYSDFEINICLSDYLRKNDTYISIIDKKTDTEALSDGKKLIIKQRHSGVSINRVNLKCTERNDNFQFSFCIINCKSVWFKDVAASYLIEAKANKKRPKSLVINCNSEEINLNAGSQIGETISLEPDLNLKYDEEKFYKILINEESFNDENIVCAKLEINDVILDIIFKEESPVNVNCSGIKIEQKKLFAKKSFLYKGNNKLVLGTNEYNTRDELRINIELEEFIVKNRCLSCSVYNNEYKEEKLEVNDEIRNAYYAMLDFYIANNTLPSLAYYDKELSALALDYVNAVFYALSDFEQNKPLLKSQQDILRIGVVNYPDRDTIAYSPLHPLNVAYQILLSREADDMKHEIREEILKKLCSDNLMPIIRNEKGKLCTIFEQKHSPQWTYYYQSDIKKYNGSRDFVSTIVKEKIEEFRSHFKYLFGNVGRNKLIINAVNMGDCYNLFKGIVNYYKKQLNDEKSPESMLTIIVNVYNDEEIYNVFECLSQKSALKHFLNGIGIKEENSKFSENELINCLVSKIRYYRKDKDSEKYEYCHLSFIEMDQTTNEDFSNHADIRSGVMLNGLVSGVSSTYYGGSHSYRTGYGSKFNLDSDAPEKILKLADLYNSAMYVFGKSSPYDFNHVLCTSIDETETMMIEKTYDSSNWVVFIEPKVDLNFFKNSDKDVMIIHYSDQHTTSSGYDAITVTRKTEQYANILKEYLTENNLSAGDNKHIREMIDMFNAVNGDWLLKLISSNDNFGKEKISIQSAIKLALAFFKCDNIMWIPISLEEILRVSGAVGLSQNGGLFSAKNLGYSDNPTSDDLLMFGVELRNNKVYVHLYPLEVKIGYKNSDELTKAKEQIKRTKDIFESNLSADSDFDALHRKFYRNFIAQLAVMSAEKLNLYNVWGSQDWERIVNDDIRGKLLNDDFIISNELHDKIGDGIIISFKDGAYVREIYKNEVTILKFLQKDGLEYLTKSVDEIVDALQKMQDISGQLFRYEISDTIKLSDEKKTVITSDISLDINYNDNDIADNIIKQKIVSEVENKSSEGMKILFGHDVNNGSPVYWYPNNTEKVMHPNTGIIGTMGTGKTQFTKSLILQLMREQKNNPGNEPIGILIFDYKGDYNNNKTDFIKATNAKVYDLYHLPFNPFAITVTSNSKPMLPMHIASTFRETLSTAYNLGKKQEAALRECIMQAYALRGIDKADKSTWTKKAPVLQDVFNVFQSSESFKEDSLYSALSELNEFEIFETDPNKTIPLYELIDGVTVINLQGYDPSIQNLVVAITLDLFYSQMQANGHSKIEGKLRQLRKFILVDEADNFLKLGFSSIRKILKEGREFGVGTILSTQFLKHFDTQQDDFSKYILSWIVHKVDDLSYKDIKNLFNTDSKSAEEELLSTIKKLSMHHSLVKLGDSVTPYYTKDRAFWEILQEENL